MPDEALLCPFVGLPEKRFRLYVVEAKAVIRLHCIRAGIFDAVQQGLVSRTLFRVVRRILRKLVLPDPAERSRAPDAPLESPRRDASRGTPAARHGPCRGRERGTPRSIRRPCLCRVTEVDWRGAPGRPGLSFPNDVPKSAAFLRVREASMSYPVSPVLFDASTEANHVPDVSLRIRLQGPEDLQPYRRKHTAESYASRRHPPHPRPDAKRWPIPAARPRPAHPTKCTACESGWDSQARTRNFPWPCVLTTDPLAHMPEFTENFELHHLPAHLKQESPHRPRAG